MKEKSKIKISIILVNYNVKDFIEQALISIKRALKGISSEIFVVDNASIDGSVQMLRRRFPEVQLIENNKNVGFSAGNNIAIKEARGDYIVLINPDTVVQEDTFTNLVDFFDRNPQASAATCKILNPDGSFSIDCRHSIPTPLTAFWKLIGFTRLFPKSKIFGKYNLTYLNENETYRVEAVSGSFMMLKREIVQKVGLLDETFFMYCEDIDYCHRINQAGGKIYYVPDSQLIHYKGESTKKNNLDYIITFNKSLYKFYKKHYQQKYINPFKWLILLGIILRGTLIFFRNNFTVYYPFLLDFLILNTVMFTSFFVRYELKDSFLLDDFFNKYIFINIITTIVYFLASLFFDSLNKERYSITKIVKANFVTYTFVSALTFFFNQFAFSRMVVVTSAIFSAILIVLWRIVLRSSRKKPSSVQGRGLFLKRALIVGYDDETESLLKKLTERVDTGIEVVGVVAFDRKHIGEKLAASPVVTSIDQLPEYLRMEQINLVIFSTHNLPYKSILTTMSEAHNPRVEFKMAPGHLEFMIGKSSIEPLDTVPLIDIEYAYGMPFNSFIKRSFDVTFSFLLLLLLMPFYFLLLPVLLKSITKKTIYVNNKLYKEILWSKKKGFLRFLLNLFETLRGNLSFVGAPITSNIKEAPQFDYKPGLTGLVQINRQRIISDQNLENYELYYLKNQNLFVDLEIILRTLFKPFKAK